MNLLPCIECRRHARADEPACPFCGGALAAPPALHERIGRVTRAMIFYGAATLAGCGEADDPPAPPPPALVEPPMQPVAVEPAAPAAAPVEPAAVAVEPPPFQEDPAQAQAERVHAERRKDRGRGSGPQIRTRDIQRVNLAMPYGAPPADFDLV